MVYIFLTACVVAGVAIFALELAARTWIAVRRTYFVRHPNTSVELALDPSVSPRLEPIVVNRFNRFGERGDSPVIRANEKVARVLVVGGSAAECYFLDQSKTWPAQLQARLQKQEAREALGVTRVEVTTLARSSLRSSDAAELLARSQRPQSLIDIIVLNLGSSDGLDWLKRGAPPAFALRPRTVEDLFLMHPEHTFTWRPSETAVVEVIRRLRWTLQPTRRIANVGRFLKSARRMRREGVELDALPDCTAMLSHLEDGIRRCFAAAQSATPHVVFVPQRYFFPSLRSEEDEQMLWLGGLGDPSESADIRQYLKPSDLNGMMDLINGVCERVADEVGVHIAPTEAEFQLRSEYFYDDFHLTERGAGALASVVADTILRTAQAMRNHESLQV